MNNQDLFLNAANWAFKNEQNFTECGINIRRSVFNKDLNQNIVLLNGSKGLMFDGFSYPEQEVLKGLIVLEENNVATKVLACCFPKFYNYGEPAEKENYQKYLNNSNEILFTNKADGVNIRPWVYPNGNKVFFATRGMPFGFPLGFENIDEDESLDYGKFAFEICQEKYPKLLNADLIRRYSLIFEMIHPESKILTDYGDTKDLILLSAFDLNDNCRELTYDELQAFHIEFGVNIIGTWNVSRNSNDFDATINQLQIDWDNTDQEGTVATFINKTTHQVQYRLKIKNKYYLQMLRLAKFCTLKNLRELIEEKNLTTWDSVREYLYSTSTSMNEELEMAYKVHYDTYNAWQERLNVIKNDILTSYRKLPLFDSRKEFAQHIANFPIKSIYFMIKDWETVYNHHANTFWDSPNERALALLEKMHPLTGE